MELVVQQKKDQTGRHPGSQLHQIQIVRPLHIAPLFDLKLLLQSAQFDRLFDRDRLFASASVSTTDFRLSSTNFSPNSELSSNAFR